MSDHIGDVNKKVPAPGELTREQVAEQLCNHTSTWAISVAAWSTLSPSQKEFYLVMADWVLAQTTQQAQEVEKLKGVLGANEVLVERLAAMTTERDELKYRLQVMADTVGEEDFSLRQQLAASQQGIKRLKERYEAPKP